LVAPATYKDVPSLAALTLIGAEALSKENVSWIINMLSLAILNKILFGNLLLCNTAGIFSR